MEEHLKLLNNIRLEQMQVFLEAMFYEQSLKNVGGFMNLQKCRGFVDLQKCRGFVDLPKSKRFRDLIKREVSWIYGKEVS